MAPIEEKRLGGGRLSAKPFAAFLGLAALAGVGCLIWWGLQPPGLSPVLLPDGTRVALASVTYGTTHQFDPAPPLFRLLRGLKLPQEIPDVATVTTGKPESRAWFYVREGPPSRRSLDLFLFFEDEHGCPFDEGEFDNHNTAGSKETWTSLKPPPPIVDGRAFDVRAFDRAARTEVLRFHVDAPASPQQPQVKSVLTPRPLPQTVSGKNLRATLQSVTPVSAPNVPHYRAAISAAGASGAALSAMTLIAEDQYGRRMRPFDPYQRQQLTGKGFPFLGLCRREPAWKLRATLAPLDGSVERANLKWEFPVTPEKGNGITLRRGDTNVTMSQTNAMSNLGPDGTKGLRMLELRVTGSSRPGPSRVIVTHIDGREARRVVSDFASRFPVGTEPVLSADLTPENGWYGDLTVPSRAGAKSVAIRCVEYLGRTVEFVIAPPGE